MNRHKDSIHLDPMLLYLALTGTDMWPIEIESIMKSSKIISENILFMHKDYFDTETIIEHEGPNQKYYFVIRGIRAKADSSLYWPYKISQLWHYRRKTNIFAKLLSKFYVWKEVL